MDEAVTAGRAVGGIQIALGIAGLAASAIGYLRGAWWFADPLLAAAGGLAVIGSGMVVLMLANILGTLLVQQRALSRIAEAVDADSLKRWRAEHGGGRN